MHAPTKQHEKAERMLISYGTLLALLTWVGLTVAVLISGLSLATLTSTPGVKLDNVLRRSLWWGFAFFVAAILIASLVTPLQSSLAIGIVFSILLGFSVVGFVVLLNALRESRVLIRRIHWGWGLWVVIAVVITVSVLLAVRGLGPANNYDSGLYHLGATRYAGEFGTVPGLANLLNALGYSNSVIPGAAFMGNGPWNGNGYRFFNGFMASLVLSDLAIRLAFRSRSVGTLLLIIGVTGFFLPLVAITDFWVTSPTSDSAVMLLSLISAVYLSDFVTSRKNIAANAGVVGVVLVIMVSMRPTMLFFAAGSTLVLLIVFFMRRSNLRSASLARTLGGLGVIAGAVGAIQVYRDYLLSGWLLYPLSILPFDVSWRAVDPINLREATLAAARDPSAPEYWPVAHSWMWVDEWFIARWSMWETYFFSLGVVVLVVAFLVARAHGTQIRYKALSLTVFPAFVVVAAWFTVIPPSYRFIWGPLFLTVMVPLAFVLHSIRARWVKPLLIAGLAVSLGAVTLFTAIARISYGEISRQGAWSFGPVTIPYLYAPSPLPETQDFITESGLVLRVPVVGDQCWGVFPLCTSIPDRAISLRGESIHQGFTISGN